MRDKVGICHICGVESKLTKEHIPPQAAFNKLSRKMHSTSTVLPIEDMNSGHEKKRYHNFQGGVNFYSLCENCNSKTGAMYGRTYTDVTKRIGYEIMKIPKDERKNIVRICVERINPQRFFKQVISMFCTVNLVSFGVQFKDYLLDENDDTFNSERYKVCMYLHHGTMDRISTFYNVIRSDGTNKTCSEISTFPFGYILYDLRRSTGAAYDGTDITDWGTKTSNEKTLEIELPFLVCNTEIITDFNTSFT